MYSLNTLHPIVLFSYFAVITGLTMFYMHPVLLIISIICAVLLNVAIDARAFMASLKWFVPFALIAALINPLISHDGEIVLFYVNYQPITLEAVVYGLAMSCMLLAVLFWFNAFSKLMTTDKFIYLFGKISPAVALLISVTMRLIPRFKQQLHLIMNAQKAIGMDPSVGSTWQRIKSAMRVLSILVSWALENGIESADSMKARGYGLQGRSTFSIFMFTKRDGGLLALITTLFAVQLFVSWHDWNDFYFYPTFSELSWHWPQLIVYSSYAMLALLPLLLELQEVHKWRSLTSKISISRIHSPNDLR